MSSKGGKKQNKNATKSQQTNNNGPAPRRNNRRRRPQNAKNSVQQREIKILGNPALTKGEGDRGTIMVDVPLEPTAVECFPLAFISVALSMGFINSPSLQIYHAYVARMTDIILMLKGQTPVVPARLSFENYIDATYVPKDVPFKTGTIATSWTNTDVIQSPPLIMIRGYTYYMYVPTGSYVGTIWRTLSAPTIPTLEDASPVLSKVYNFISSDRVPHIKYTTSLDTHPEYKNDISGFGANATFYGAGNSPAGAPVKSTEWEVPVKAPLLSCFSALQAGSERVGRHLKIAGGDSTFVNGMALIPGFEQEIFKSKLNPVFCFLDLDEVVVWLQSWYLSLVEQSYKNSGQQLPDGSTYDYNRPFPYSAQTFRAAVRQVILTMFVQTQAASQFITYSGDARGFEPFRVGTNAYPKIRNTMTFPLLLVENIRMLLPKFLYPQSTIQRKHNQQLYCPVWGVYKGSDREPMNLVGVLYDQGTNSYVDLNLFTSDINPDDPGIIDGRNANNIVCDLNSNIIDEVIADWNDRVADLQLFSSTTSYLGGASAGTLLTISRYAQYKDTDFKVSNMTRLQQKNIEKQFVQKRKLTRSVSGTAKGGVMVEEDYYIPPSTSLFAQYTNAYSSLAIITETTKQVMNYFIIPTYVIESTSVPTIRQVRTAVTQSHIIEYPRQTDDQFTTDSRGGKLRELGKKCAPGIASAGKADEFISVLQAYSDASKGGFFGELLGAVIPMAAPLTALIPF